jgi:hypothetical protein
VYRLLSSVPTAQLQTTLVTLLDSPLAGDVTQSAIKLLGEQFATLVAPGVTLAVEAAGILEDPDTLAPACVMLARKLLDALDG